MIHIKLLAVSQRATRGALSLEISPNFLSKRTQPPSLRAMGGSAAAVITAVKSNDCQKCVCASARQHAQDKHLTFTGKSMPFHINEAARICTYLTSWFFFFLEVSSVSFSLMGIFRGLASACLHRRHVLIIHVFTEIIDQSGVNKNA